MRKFIASMAILAVTVTLIAPSSQCFAESTEVSDGKETVEINIDDSLEDKIDVEDVEKVLTEDIVSENDTVEVVALDELADDTYISEECICVVNDEDIIPVVIDEDVNITGEELTELIDDSDNKIQNGDIVNVTDLNEVEEAPAEGAVYQEEVPQDETLVSPEWKWYDIKKTIKNSYKYGSENVASDKFITSVAKGQKKKISTSFSLSCSVGASASYYNLATVKSELGAKMTFSVSNTFSGPSNKSKYNSREFRVKFYSQKVDVTQKVKGWPSKHTTTYKFTYNRPTKYLQYSIDRKI